MVTVSRGEEEQVGVHVIVGLAAPAKCATTTLLAGLLKVRKTRVSPLAVPQV
jgi:hypothetical protein